jgi:hypothetical protein
VKLTRTPTLIKKKYEKVMHLVLASCNGSPPTFSSTNWMKRNRRLMGAVFFIDFFFVCHFQEWGFVLYFQEIVIAFFFLRWFFPDFALIIVGFRSYSCHSRDKINIKLYAANLNFKLR